MADDASPDAGIRTWTREFPADWPDNLAAAAMAVTLLQSVNLRQLRHVPRARVTIQQARTAAQKAYEELKAVHEARP